VHHRNVGAQGTVHPKALVAEEHAKGGRGEAWIALAAVAACLVRLLLQQSSQVLHSDRQRRANEETELRVGPNRISSQLPVSDLSE